MYSVHVADIGDGGNEVEGVHVGSVIVGIRGSGASENGDSTEVREKPGGVGDASREGAKMKSVEEIVALYQGRGLYSEEELEGCLRERYRVEREESC